MLKCETKLDAFNPIFQLYDYSADVIDKDLKLVTNEFYIHSKFMKEVFKSKLKKLNEESLPVRKLINRLNRKLSSYETDRVIKNMARKKC